MVKPDTKTLIGQHIRNASRAFREGVFPDVSSAAFSVWSHLKSLPPFDRVNSEASQRMVAQRIRLENKRHQRKMAQ